jgi:Flp pilus assembly protein TadG
MLVRPRCPSRTRRGASLVEGAIVLLVFLTLILGAMDLGMAILRQELVGRIAREAARIASVHGQYAPSGWNGGPWGTGTIDVDSNATGIPLVGELASNGAFSGLNRAQTRVRVEWIDGNTDPEVERNRVRVTVTTTYRPMVTFIFGSPTWTLTGVSAMNILH